MRDLDMGRANRIDYPSSVKVLHPAAVEFIEQLALIAESDGFPRIAGKIAGLLVINQEPMSFDELVEQLQVSRGSISTNTRLLETRSVIRRVGRIGERRDLFEIGPDFPERFLARQIERHRALQRICGDARKGLPSNQARTKEALKQMEELHGLLIDSTEKTLVGWKKRKK